MGRDSLLFVVLAIFMVMFAPAALAAPPWGVEITVFGVDQDIEIELGFSSILLELYSVDRQFR